MNAGCRPKVLKSAIMRAVEELPPTKRGRPPKVIRIAPRQLGLELAEIFRRYTGRAPMRRYDESKGEYGPFRDFVAIACEILNSEFVRPASKRPLFSVATVVRYGIDYFCRPISERARSPGSFHQVPIESE
jgi:hypothetical protein